MTYALAVQAKNIKNAAALTNKDVNLMIELEQLKIELSSISENIENLRDSL